MKKKAVFLTFFLLWKPLIPLFQYAIRYDFIIKVLCENREKPEMQCYGTCYLKSELAKVSQDSSSIVYKDLKTGTILIYLMIDVLNLSLLQQEKNIVITLYNNLYSYLKIFSVFHPPSSSSSSCCRYFL